GVRAGGRSRDVRDRAGARRPLPRARGLARAERVLERPPARRSRRARRGHDEPRPRRARPARPRPPRTPASPTDRSTDPSRAGSLVAANARRRSRANPRVTATARLFRVAIRVTDIERAIACY